MAEISEFPEVSGTKISLPRFSTYRKFCSQNRGLSIAEVAHVHWLSNATKHGPHGLSGTELRAIPIFGPVHFRFCLALAQLLYCQTATATLFIFTFFVNKRHL
jgi:hypothetical protein